MDNTDCPVCGAALLDLPLLLACMDCCWFMEKPLLARGFEAL